MPYAGSMTKIFTLTLSMKVMTRGAEIKVSSALIVSTEPNRPTKFNVVNNSLVDPLTRLYTL